MFVLHRKMKFSIKETADLVTFTEEIFNGKLQFLCSVVALRTHCKPCHDLFNQVAHFLLSQG